METIFEFISSTRDGVFAVDRDQRIVLWNEGAREKLGYEPRDVLGRRCYRVLKACDRDGTPICKRQCLAMRMAGHQQPLSTADVLAWHENGQRVWLNLSTVLVPSAWEDLSVLVHLFRDVNRQHEIEDVVRDLASVLSGLSLSPGDSRSSSPQSQNGPPVLTHREREVLRLLAGGASTETIAKRLFISPITVRNHVQNMLGKLGVHSRLEAVAYSLKNDLL